ncbi:MAG: type I secretion C-terminal target domain-containing protein, partial [Aquabacterium sp.]|nr:type I secretion C-terminal target domain-containing protein [Aquabacterium sp.]
ATVVSGATANPFNSNDAAITDNDKPYLVVYGQDAEEGQPTQFTVNLTQASPGPVTVKLDLLVGSDPVNAATPGVDTIGPLEFFNTTSQQWEPVAGDLTLAAGQTQLKVRVATVDDSEIEGLEFIQLQASVVSGETVNTVASNDAAITDNDKPYMVVYSTDPIEGQMAHYTVNLTAPTAEVVSVTLALQAGGTPADAAQPGSDSTTDLEFFNATTQQWEAVTGPVSFQPGDMQIQVRVATLDDAYVEPVEYLRLHATVVEGQVINPITWNDAAITDNEGRLITGTADGDEIVGQAGDDTLQGLAGDDLLIGGQGNDLFNGGEGGDVFAWRLSDVVTGQTTVDRIEAFDLAPHAAGGDVLDLRDLLQGEHTEGGTGNLTQYLHFDTSGTDTLIQISVNGDLAAITQEIVLEGVNLRAGFGLDAGAGDGLVIARMLADQKLWVDAA